MITNILDRRTHLHLWRQVDAVSEATWHDNAPEGTPNHDRATRDPSHDDVFAVRSNIPVSEAVVWAQGLNDEVTLYLYDAGSWGHDIDT